MRAGLVMPAQAGIPEPAPAKAGGALGPHVRHGSSRGDDGQRPRSGPDRYVPFSEHLGLRVEHAQQGTSRVSVELRAEHLNNHASAHGGVVMSLLDSAMAHAALSRVDYGREVVTVDMHIAFMRPTQGRLLAEGRASGGGRSVCFCEATITDASGEVAARAMGTFRYRDPA